MTRSNSTHPTKRVMRAAKPTKMHDLTRPEFVVTLTESIISIRPMGARKADAVVTFEVSSIYERLLMKRAL